MKILDYNDIDFSQLVKKEINYNQNDLYENNGELIKIFKGLSEHERTQLFKKYEDMRDIIIDGVIKPDKYIVKTYFRYGKEKFDFLGYTMPKFENSSNVNNHFYYVDSYKCSDLFKVLKKASIILKEIHENNIIFQDFSFFNILFDKNDYNNVKIIDMDSCCYNKNGTAFVSYDLKYYYENILGERFIPATKNNDKLSMILSLSILLFSKEIDEISNSDYEEKARKIKTLENLKEYYLALRDGKIDLCSGEIPYLHELIDDNESYVFKNFI